MSVDRCEAPRPEESNFDYKVITHSGLIFPAHLTYDLKSDNRDRCVLRVSSKEARQIWPDDLLTNPAYRELSTRLSTQGASGRGRTSAAKRVTVDLAQLDIPDVTISVHRFGAVPVSFIGDTHAIQFGDRTLNVRLGVYPYQWEEWREEGQLTKADLLRSFEYKLDQVLRSYLEEVAEEFSDIEHHSSRPNSFRRLKAAEDILARSVKSKVQLILTHAAKPGDPVLHTLATRVWERYSTAIANAAHARVYCLYFINELYKFIGIHNFSAKYAQEWNKSADGFAGLYDEEQYLNLLSPGSNPDLSLLDQAIRHYWQGHDDFEDLINQAGGREWLTRLLEFARFVSAVRCEDHAVFTPKIFISAQHRVGGARGFVREVRDYVEEHSKAGQASSVRLTEVRQEVEGREIRRVVKARIWESTGVVSVVPADWETTMTGEQADLEWLALEADHAILLDRRLSFFLDHGIQGVDAVRERIQKEFERDLEYLSPAHGRLNTEERKRRLAERLTDYVTNSFRYVDGGLDGLTKRNIEELVERTRARFGRELIIGFLEQFTVFEQRTIAQLLQILKYPMTRAELEKELAKVKGTSENTARRVFNRIWVKLKERRFAFQRPLSLISFEQKKYKSNLRYVLDRIRPELRIPARDLWHDSILAGILGPADRSVRPEVQ